MTKPAFAIKRTGVLPILGHGEVGEPSSTPGRPPALESVRCGSGADAGTRGEAWRDERRRGRPHALIGAGRIEKLMELVAALAE